MLPLSSLDAARFTLKNNQQVVMKKKNLFRGKIPQIVAYGPSKYIVIIRPRYKR